MLFVEGEVDSMPKSKNHVRLTVADRKALQEIVTKGSTTARTIMHANVLLAADEGSAKGRTSEAQIARLLHVSRQTVHSIRQQYSEHGLSSAVHRKKRETPPIPAKITGDVEARIIALSCSEPPQGRSRWTLRLLADKAVELEYIESISYVAVGNVLKKTSSNRT